jgi:hypothetical protein
MEKGKQSAEEVELHPSRLNAWRVGEIEVALELLYEMRIEISKFHRDKKNFPNEDRLYYEIGKRVVEWFDD